MGSMVFFAEAYSHNFFIFKGFLTNISTQRRSGHRDHDTCKHKLLHYWVLINLALSRLKQVFFLANHKRWREDATDDDKTDFKQKKLEFLNKSHIVR